MSYNIIYYIVVYYMRPDAKAGAHSRTTCDPCAARALETQHTRHTTHDTRHTYNNTHTPTPTATHTHRAHVVFRKLTKDYYY